MTNDYISVQQAMEFADTFYAHDPVMKAAALALLRAVPRVEKPEPLTNGDWIRAMSDEELAGFIGRNSLCERAGESSWCEKRAVCENCLLEWLQQAAEEVTP